LLYVPAIIRVKEAMIAAAPAEEPLKRGLGGAQYANIILTLGRVALAGGKPSAARDALKRLRKVAPDHPELGRFGLDLALSTNDLGKARSILEGDSTSMAIVEAVFAYERLDPKALKQQLPLLQDKERAEALLVGLQVQTGKKLLSEEDAAEFKDCVWGYAIKVDSALYRGELSRAEQLLRDWNEPGSSAYLARKAQLVRYQGDAETALKLARQGNPEQNLRAFCEELQALVAAGRAKEALEIVKDKERSKVLGPLEKWTENFVTGKARGPKAALGTIGYLRMPNNSTPLPVRMMAARAMHTSGDLRYKDIDVLLEAVVPKHPELGLARKDLDEE
jgi:predicted Zn-dependent protease